MSPPAVAVAVTGSGLAELTCARLLAGRGHRVWLGPEPGAAATGPRPLLLNQPTLELLRSLWGAELLEGTWELDWREVAWGDTTAVRFPQPARVVDGALLATRMRARLRSPDRRRDETADPWLDETAGPARDATADPWLDETADPARDEITDPARDVTADPWLDETAGPARDATADPWLDETAGPARDATADPGYGGTVWRVTAEPPDDAHHTYGRRVLLAGTVPLARGRDERTARLATARLGWVHLTPLGGGRCRTQALGPGPADDPAALLARLLDESGLSGLLRHPPRTAVVVPASPRLHPAPARPPSGGAGGVLTVGAGALRCDPLSGTGTAQALRTGILAAAVIDAAAGGTPADTLCAHYAARLRAALGEHLRSCARLYGAAFRGEAWQDEFAPGVSSRHR